MYRPSDLAHLHILSGRNARSTSPAACLRPLSSVYGHSPLLYGGAVTKCPFSTATPFFRIRRPCVVPLVRPTPSPSCKHNRYTGQYTDQSFAVYRSVYLPGAKVDQAVYYGNKPVYRRVYLLWRPCIPCGLPVGIRLENLGNQESGSRQPKSTGCALQKDGYALGNDRHVLRKGIRLRNDTDGKSSAGTKTCRSPNISRRIARITRRRRSAPPRPGKHAAKRLEKRPGKPPLKQLPAKRSAKHLRQRPAKHLGQHPKKRLRKYPRKRSKKHPGKCTEKRLGKYAAKRLSKPPLEQHPAKHPRQRPVKHLGQRLRKRPAKHPRQNLAKHPRKHRTICRQMQPVGRSPRCKQNNCVRIF